MKSLKLLFLTSLFSVFSYAQVGINTTSIDPSAALDIQYGTTPKGLLTPRMTTVQRAAMSAPADGLIVYDTDLKSFYHYRNGTTPGWVRMSSEVSGRTNFKRIKSLSDLAAEKTAGGGTKYLLDTNTYYEVNGAITFDAPIDLNNAYLVGLDANEDKLMMSTGVLMAGTFGGTIKNLSLIGNPQGQGGTLFSLDGSATQAGLNPQNLLLRDCIVQQFTSIGTIKGFGLVFSGVVQYVGNGGGITYENITRLLLSNIAWFGNNKGTFETYRGTFGLIQKLGGFSEVNGTAVGMDVSANPTISGDAVMESVVFTGTPTGTGGYVNGYTSGNYTGYNFNNRWNVRSAGIPTETDAVSTAHLFKTNNRTATRTNAAVADIGYKVDTGTTTSKNLFRMTSDDNGTLKYTGKKPRAFQASATISFEATLNNTNTDYVFYFAKIGANGTTVTPLPESETYIDTNNNYIQAFPVSGTIVLAENESVQLHLKRITTGNNVKTNIDVRSYNLSLK